MGKLIPRESYMAWLDSFRDRPMIKVLTGMRRVGKSTCLRMFAEHLRKSGVLKRQIVSLNFEEIENDELLDSRKLYGYLKSRMIHGKTIYIFLDEIQRVDRFEEVLDSLHVKKGVDLYVTGSNARMFSSEIATVLTGRYVELNVLPFSFAEIRDELPGSNDARKFMDYLTYGALPESFAFSAGSSEQRQYVESVYNTILSKDVLKRNATGSRIVVDAILRYMIDNVGNLTSAKRISDRLSAGGTKVCANTVQSYLEILCDCYFLYKADRFDVVGGENLKLINKYYLTDFAFKYHILGNPTVEVQQLLENAVYIELLRRRYKVATGRVRDKEVDFVIQDGKGDIRYVQVAVTVATPEKLTQELAAFRAIRDNHPKYILTMDSLFVADHGGVKTRNVLEFLCGGGEL